MGHTVGLLYTYSLARVYRQPEDLTGSQRWLPMTDNPLHFMPFQGVSSLLKGTEQAVGVSKTATLVCLPTLKLMCFHHPNASYHITVATEYPQPTKHTMFAFCPVLLFLSIPCKTVSIWGSWVLKIKTDKHIQALKQIDDYSFLSWLSS